MATPNIVPRSDSEGGLGTASKYWASAYIDFVYVGAGKVGRDTDNLIDFSTDNVIAFRVANSDRVKLSDTALFPVSNSGSALGGSSNRWADLFLDSGAVINFDNGNVTLTHTNNKLIFGDSDQLGIGNDADLVIYHDTQDTYITNDTGHLYIENKSNDKDIIFKCDDHEGGVETYFFLDGSRNTSGDQSPYTVFPDGATLALGSDADLRLKHTGSAGTITNNTGDLTIINNTNDGDIVFVNDDGSGGTATYMTIDGDNTLVEFSKGAQFSSGSYVKLLDSIKAFIGTGNDLELSHDGTDSWITNSTGHLKIYNNANNKDIIFASDDGDGGVATYFQLDGSSAAHDGSATTALYTNWPDKSYISLGTGHDLQIYHDGTNSALLNTDGDLYIINSADGKDIIFQSDDGSGGTETYFFLDGSRGGANPATVFPDNSRLMFGNTEDLIIYHDGNNNFIQNQIGDLTIKNLANDKDIIFQSDDGSGGITTFFFLDGSHGGGPVTMFPDNSSINFGTTLGDLKITHDGSNSIINNGTGSLVLRQSVDDGDIIFQSDDSSGGTAEYFRLDGGAEKVISAKQFQANAGIELAGNLNAPDNSIIRLGSGADLQILHDGSNSFIHHNNTGDLEIKADSGDIKIVNYANDKDIIFKSDDGSGGTTAYLTLDGSDGTMRVDKKLVLADNVKTSFGGGEDLQIYHDGNHSWVRDTGTGNLYLGSDGFAVNIVKGENTETIAEFIPDGAVKLYYDNSKKFETTSSGVAVTGGLTTTSTVVLSNLPTSDPSVAGQLWNDSGTLKISAG